MRIPFLNIATSLLVGVLLLMSNRPLIAAEDVVVRLSAKPDTVWIGEKVVLLLDVLGKDGWAQLTKVHDHKLGGGYLKRFESQGTRLQETIGGAGYTGQRYEYFFFPQRAGKLVLEPVTIDVEVKRWGAETENEMTRTSTPPLELNVNNPRGVQSGEVMISTSDFTATQTWEPEQNEFSVGDAVTRMITLEADDISGMVFPAIEHKSISGLGIYPSSPTVEDNYDRGDLTGKRTEKLTYVMEQGGQFAADDLTYNWWNIKTEKLETVTLDGITFTVKAPTITDTADKISSLPDGRSSAGYLWAAGIIIPLVVFGLLLRKSIVLWYRAWQEKKNASEKAYFRSVTQAAQSKDNRELLKSAMRWLDQLSKDDVPPRLDQYLSRYGEAESVETYTKFCTGVGSADWSNTSQKFYEVLVKSRSNWIRITRTRKKIDHILPPVGIR